MLEIQHEFDPAGSFWTPTSCRFDYFRIVNALLQAVQPVVELSHLTYGTASQCILIACITV
jgi:hypothetical protein